MERSGWWWLRCSTAAVSDGAERSPSASLAAEELLMVEEGLRRW